MKKNPTPAFVPFAVLAGASLLTPLGAQDVVLNGDVLSVGSTTSYGQLSLGYGHSRIDMGGGATLTFSSVSRSAGATLLARVPSNTSVVFTDFSGLGLVGGGGATATSKSVIPWMVGGSSTSADGLHVMTYSEATGLRPLVDADYTTALGTATEFDNVRTGNLSLTADKAINALRITSGGDASFTAGRTLTVNSGALTFSGATGGIAAGGTINFGSTEGFVYAAGTNTNSIKSVIAGSGGLTKSSTGTLVLSGANTYTGTTTVAAGTLRAGAANVLNNTAVVLANTTTTALVTGSPTVVTTLDLNGFNQSVASLSGGGASGGNVALGTATLSVGHSGAEPATTYAGVISGTGSVVKSGTSTQIIAGANLYSGGTTISGGDLRFANTTGSATGTGAVGLTGGTISGTGSADGLVTVQNGAYIAAGANSVALGTGRGNFGTAGTLGLGTVGGLTLTSASFDFDLAAINTVGAGVNDLVTTSALALGSAVSFSFNGLDGALQTGVAYTLIDADSVSGFDAGSISTSFLGAISGQYTASYSIGAGNDLLVTFTSTIPEPASAAVLLGAGALLAGGFRRHRRGAR